MSLAIIDYLAGYYVGRETNSHDYKLFMQTYFPYCYRPFLDIIYSQIRCGLMHNLVAFSPWKSDNQMSFVIQDKSQLHLVEIEEKMSFSIPIFVEDTRRSFIIYQHDLIMNSTKEPRLAENFDKRFKRINGKASAMVIVP